MNTDTGDVSLFFAFLWVSVRVPTDSVPSHTISEERGGDYCAIASSQGVLSEVEKRDKERVGFDWWMVWM